MRPNRIVVLKNRIYKNRWTIIRRAASLALLVKSVLAIVHMLSQGNQLI